MVYHKIGLEGLNQEVSVKTASEQCIQAIQDQFKYQAHANQLQIPAFGSDSEAGQLVRFCGLVVDESQEDEYYLPLQLDSNGCWKNVALFKVPEEIEGADEVPFEHLQVRRSVRVVPIPGWSQWSRDLHHQRQDQPGELCVILYGEQQNDQCRLGSSHEFYGIVDGEGCLHLINALPFKIQEASEHLIDARGSLLNHLVACLGGNEEAAQLLLVNLVSTVTERTPGASCQLNELVAALRPTSLAISVDAGYLDTVQLTPCLDLDSGVLGRGDLQLSTGTHVILDESGLITGKFSERATNNLKALMDLMEHQQLNIDFGMQACPIPVDYPVLGVSRGGKSILPFLWAVRVPSITAMESDGLTAWRQYLEHCRAITVTIGSEVATELEQEYVRIRKEFSKFEENQFGAVLNLAKLLAKSLATPALTMAHWNTALSLHSHLLI